MIDVMAIKLKVIEASCGITALSETELLERLEKLYVEGISEGIRISTENIKKSATSISAPSAPTSNCSQTDR